MACLHWVIWDEIWVIVIYIYMYIYIDNFLSGMRIQEVASFGDFLK